MITKKCLTLDEGIKHLLKSTKEETLIGITGVSTAVQKLPAMKDVLFSGGIAGDLVEFLESQDPSIKTKRKANKDKFYDIVNKCPLIKVLDSVENRQSIGILVEEINKQTKGKV